MPRQESIGLAACQFARDLANIQHSRVPETGVEKSANGLHRIRWRQVAVVPVNRTGRLSVRTRVGNASVNSTCAQALPRADPRELAFFLPWMANSRGWGLLSWQIPRGGDEKRGQMPRPPSTVQHFLLIAQSNSAILKCDFLFQLTSSFVIALGF